MTVGQLIKELGTFPKELEVHIEVNGTERIAMEVDWYSGGVSSWIIINDYTEMKQGI